jgi:hypothetical protein
MGPYTLARPHKMAQFSEQRGRGHTFYTSYCAYLPPLPRPTTPEMEFLDINLTKDSSLLLHVIHSISIGGFVRKPDSTLV